MLYSFSIKNYIKKELHYGYSKQKILVAAFKTCTSNSISAPFNKFTYLCGYHIYEPTWRCGTCSIGHGISV